MIEKYSDASVLNTLIILSLIFVAAITLYPLWFVLIASFSNPMFIGSGEVTIIPKGFTALAYQAMFDDKRIWVGYGNSLLYTAFGTFLDIAVTIPCAYSLSRAVLPGKKIFMFFFLFTMYFAGGLMPLYLWLSKLNLINNRLVLILPLGISVFNLLIAMGYLKDNIPEDIFEAAIIDGSSITRFFFTFVVPLSKAIIAVLVLFYGLAHWNRFFYPMLFIQDNAKQNLQVIIRSITANLDASVIETMTSDQLNEVMVKKQLLKYAVVVVSIIPMMIVYPFVQRYFVTGIMLGAVKG